MLFRSRGGDLLQADHRDLHSFPTRRSSDLSADDWDRLYTWMDTYGQRLGSFSPDQVQRLHQLKRQMEPMLAR